MLPETETKYDGNRCGSWMQTYTGRAVHPLDLRVDDICIEDIAHALGMQCRYAGHTRWHYSVAQHSVLACRYAPIPLKLDALMHDSPEAYLVDLPRPIKHNSEIGNLYRPIEDKAWLVIASKFNLSPEISPKIKVIDNRLLLTERRDLMCKPPFPWSNEDKYPPYPEPIQRMQPDEAAALFLRTFYELYR